MCLDTIKQKREGGGGSQWAGKDGWFKAVLLTSHMSEAPSIIAHCSTLMRRQKDEWKWEKKMKKKKKASRKLKAKRKMPRNVPAVSGCASVWLMVKGPAARVR